MNDFGPDVRSLARKLIAGYLLYFAHDSLNSDGRKLFEEMARMLVYEHPELKSLVRKARRRPTLDNVMKVVERVLGEEAQELLRGAVEGPYIYWPLGQGSPLPSKAGTEEDEEEEENSSDDR